MEMGISIAVEMRDWPQREVVTYSLELLEVYWHKGIRQKQQRYWVFTFMGVLQTTL